jgi:multidrug resistance efflux pump
LQTIKPPTASYRPLEEEIKDLRKEYANQEKSYNLGIKGLQQELSLGESPYREQIKRLRAEQEFDQAQRLLSIVVTAPTDGLIGNISCKEEEHIPAYTALLSFYEPHSGIVKGYVHEDLTLQVQVGDRFMATSLKDKNMEYEGKVIGLGSRIVEIPSRLRKVPDFKSYGREVLVEITKDNSFLQKEKVSLRFISSNL